MPLPETDAPWYVRAFESIYLRVYPERDDREAERNASQIIHLLGVHAGQRVLDAACGAGRYARALARRGLRVTGVDLSETLLEDARARSPGTPGAPMYLRWDVRRLPFASQFEGAISMFTSFGYFEDREDDIRIMRGVLRALVPGGRFLVDFLNESAVRANLEPVSEGVYGGLDVRMERRIEEGAPGGPRVVKRVRASHAQTGLVEADYEESIRLYTAVELDELLREAGFDLEDEPLGDFDESPWGPETPRVIHLARRPSRSR